MFVTSQGTPYGRLRRALDRGNLLAARSAVAELGEVGIVEAFELLLVIGEQEPEKFGRAAVRWTARYSHLARDVEPAEAQALLGLLLMLPGPRAGTARRALVALLDRRGLERACLALSRGDPG